MPTDTKRALLAARLNTICHRRGLSVRQLALQSQLPLSTVQKLMGGESKQPSLWTMAQIAHTLDVSLDYLAGLTMVERPPSVA